jgi:ACR3 family arsenite efflux pump ArsB
MNRAQLLQPVFHFLARLIQKHGDILYVVLVYVAIPLVAWILGRRSGRKKLKQSHTFILVIRPPAQPLQLPPVIRWNFEPPSDNDSGPFGGF